MRYRIDCLHLQQIPRRRRDAGSTREDLAARKFNMGKASHKGRNHVSNQKRRQIIQEKAKLKRAEIATRNADARSYKNLVRAFWSGEIDEHPGKPKLT